MVSLDPARARHGQAACDVGDGVAEAGDVSVEAPLADAVERSLRHAGGGLRIDQRAGECVGERINIPNRVNRSLRLRR